MFCANCGNTIEPNGRFCSACGAPVQQEDQTVRLTQEEQNYLQPSYQQPSYQQPSYQQPSYQQPSYQQPTYQQPTYQQPTYQQPTYQQPVQPVQQPTAYWTPAPIPVKPKPVYTEMTWKEFYDTYATNKWPIWMIVICFLTAGLSFILVIAEGITIGWLDVAVYVSMGVLLLVTKHWAFSLGATIYGGIWSLVSLATDGIPSGAFAIVAGILSTIALFKLRKAYAAYRDEHIFPEDL